MKVAEFRQESDLEALKAAWTRLFDASASTSIFLSWEWTAEIGRASCRERV